MVLKILNNILDFIYPNKCVFCDEVMPLNEKDGICKYCYSDIDFIIGDKEPNLSVFCYDDITRHSILRLKYYNRRDYAKVFGRMMYNKLLKLDIKKYDYIICVPMYIKKKKKRGYDQAELIAEELSKLCGIPIEKDNLIRNKDTLPQSKVSFEDRAKNVEGVFEVVNKDTLKDKNILLVDDIYTTGNTINYCGRALRDAGANKICYFTLSKVVHKKYLDI